jgi:CheY-like chemotaxis protein
MATSPCNDADTVLVVDDEEVVAEMIAELLGGFGCAHAAFSKSAKALRYYDENSRKVTVLIAGLEMPLLSSPDLVQKALEINPTLPVVLVTNYVGKHIPDDIIPLLRPDTAQAFHQGGIVRRTGKSARQGSFIGFCG